MKTNKAVYLRLLKGFVIGLCIAIGICMLIFGRVYPAWVQGVVGAVCIVGMAVALSVELPCRIIEDIWIYRIKNNEGVSLYEKVYKKKKNIQ